MRWTIRQLAEATGGTPGGPPPSGGAYGPLTIDSREVGPGGVFVPIVAERDGHDFIEAALAAGAGAYLCAAGRPVEAPGGPHVVVADTGVALLDIGRAARRRLAGPVVGVTGSVGKTSTKDMAAATVGAARKVAASARSFNNELGVPLTLANAAEDTEVAVIEMGARGPGHIALLCTVAQPTVAVVTAVAAAHTERFGGLDAVAQAKGELVEALPSGGLAVLNGDDARVAAMSARTSAEVLRYGVAAGPASDRHGDADGHRHGHGLDVVAEAVALGDDLRARYRLRSPWGGAAVRLAARGAHQVPNSLAALAVALHLGVDLDAAVAALAGAPSSPWRMELGTAPSGARVLNDAYNANPASMEAAIEALAALPARRRVAVLGAMAELGPEGPGEHRRLARLAAERGIEVVAIGTADYGVAPVADLAAAQQALGTLDEGTAVLVKASRVAGLERLAARLLA